MSWGSSALCWEAIVYRSVVFLHLFFEQKHWFHLYQWIFPEMYIQQTIPEGRVSPIEKITSLFDVQYNKDVSLWENKVGLLPIIKYLAPLSLRPPSYNTVYWKSGRHLALFMSPVETGTQGKSKNADSLATASALSNTLPLLLSPRNLQTSASICESVTGLFSSW